MEAGLELSDSTISRPAHQFFPRLKNSPALQKSYNQNDHRDDQNNVDQTADVEREKSQSPQDDKDD